MKVTVQISTFAPQYSLSHSIHTKHVLPCAVLLCLKALISHVLFRSRSAHCAARLVYSRTPLSPSASPVPFHRSLHKQHQTAGAHRIPPDTAHRTTCLHTVSLRTQHTALHACTPYPSGHSTPHYTPAVGTTAAVPICTPISVCLCLKVSHKERLPCPLQFAIF